VKIDISRVSKPKNPSAIFFYYRCLLAAQLDQNQSINRNVLLSLSEENQNWWIKELYYLATGRNLTVKISNGRNLKSHQLIFVNSDENFDQKIFEKAENNNISDCAACTREQEATISRFAFMFCSQNRKETEIA